MMNGFDNEDGDKENVTPNELAAALCHTGGCKLVQYLKLRMVYNGWVI